MTDTRRLRVLIVDDHPVFREGLRSLIDAAPDMEVAGEAEDGDAALRLALDLDLDVVIMDLHLPGPSGVEVTRQVAAERPGIRVLVVSMFEQDDSVFAAMRAGARGYLLKGAQPDELLRAVRAVAAGDAIFGPAIAARMIDYFETGRPVPFPDLTTREREILVLIAQGRSNQAIANHLVLSLKTIRNHVSNIFTKLRVVDRAEAIVKAREAGLGSPS